MNIGKWINRLSVSVLLLLLMCCIGCSKLDNQIEVADQGTDQTETVNQSNGQSEEEVILSENKYYKIIDNYDNDGYPLFKDFMKEKDNQELIQWHLDLKEEFELRELSFQPVQQLSYYDKDQAFIREGSKMNEKVSIEGKETFVNTFYTIIVDDYFSEKLAINILDGRIFEKNDFTYQDKIPIVLGYSYQEYYSIGDTLNLNYLSENFNFVVIGFFDKDTTVKSNNAEYNLNEYICLPFFDLAISDFSNCSNSFCEIYYMIRTNGYIPAKENQEEIKEKVEEFARQRNLYYTLTENIYTLEVE